MKSRLEIMEKYDNVIQDQLQKGVIEKVDSFMNDGVRHYIPHHAVITLRKTTTKLRIVCNVPVMASKGRNSLNECLYNGPVMLQNLYGMVMRFRMHRTALAADLEKASSARRSSTQLA